MNSAVEEASEVHVGGSCGGQLLLCHNAAMAAAETTTATTYKNAHGGPVKEYGDGRGIAPAIAGKCG